MTTAWYPETFKLAVVVPIFKSGKASQCSNYKPISLTTNLSKILEKLLKKRMISFLEKYNILSDRQYGFRDKIGTSEAIEYLTNIFYDKLNNVEPVAAIFLDLQKAFDLVNHNILLAKLENIGFRGLANKFFKSYLENRKQVVKIENSVSDCKNVICGVQQGSVLGPLLFLVYINDTLLKYSDNIIAFADDTTLVCNGENWIDVENDARNKINSISRCLNANKLILNETIYNNKQHEQFNISIYDRELKNVNETKMLGIFIDKNLRWKNKLIVLLVKLIT